MGVIDFVEICENIHCACSLAMMEEEVRDLAFVDNSNGVSAPVTATVVPAAVLLVSITATSVLATAVASDSAWGESLV